MRLPEDYDDQSSNLTPTVISAIMAVTLFVGIVLVTVLLLNNQNKGGASASRQSAGAESSQAMASKQSGYPDTDKLVTGSTLSPDDLDFWDKYPVETKESTPPPEESKPKEVETVEASDPSTDGKHTMVKNRDGKEEWVLISPYQIGRAHV